MDHFDREAFAKRLKEEGSKDARRVLLAETRKTAGYQEAKQQKQEEHTELVSTREALRAGISREALLAGAREFVQVLLQKYPQVNQEGKLNYYLSGSLAVMLLVDSGRFISLDASRLPAIVPQEEIIVNETAAHYLEPFVRKVGDLDFVPLDHYTELPPEERLIKGRGIPVAELSPRTQNMFRLGQEQFALQHDPVGEKGMPHGVVRVTIGEHEVYITDPRMMLAYKAIHCGQRFADEAKTAALVNDFYTLLRSLESLYPRAELVQKAHDTMLAYVPQSPHHTMIPYYHPRFTGALRTFFDDVVAADVDAPYLSEIHYGKERSIGFLKILHRLQAPEAKRSMIGFMNTHRSLIDQWEENPLSKKEKQMRPLRPALLDLLMTVDEQHIQEELQNLGKLLELRVQPQQLEDILSSEFAADPTQRRSLYERLLRARAVLPDDRFEELHFALKEAVERFSYDPIALKSTKVKPEEWPIRVAIVFEHFGIT